MLDQLLLSQRFLRLLIFFFSLFSLVFRLGKFYCYILNFTDSICHLYYWVCPVNSYLLLYFLFFLPFLTPFPPSFLLSFLCLFTVFLFFSLRFVSRELVVACCIMAALKFLLGNFSISELVSTWLIWFPTWQVIFVCCLLVSWTFWLLYWESLSLT